MPPSGVHRLKRPSAVGELWGQSAPFLKELCGDSSLPSVQPPESGEERVLVTLYEIGGKLTDVLSFTVSKKLPMIPHIGVRMYGREYFYSNRIESEPSAAMDKMLSGFPSITFDLGPPVLSPDELQKWLESVDEDWVPTTYDVFDKNCNHFGVLMASAVSKDGIPKGYDQAILDVTEKMLDALPAWRKDMGQFFMTKVTRLVVTAWGRATKDGKKKAAAEVARDSDDGGGGGPGGGGGGSVGGGGGGSGGGEGIAGGSGDSNNLMLAENTNYSAERSARKAPGRTLGVSTAIKSTATSTEVPRRDTEKVEKRPVTPSASISSVTSTMLEVPKATVANKEHAKSALRVRNKQHEPAVKRSNGQAIKDLTNDGNAIGHHAAVEVEVEEALAVAPPEVVVEEVNSVDTKKRKKPAVIMDGLKNTEDKQQNPLASLLLAIDPSGTVRRRLWTKADFLHIHAVSGTYFLGIGLPWLVYSHYMIMKNPEQMMETSSWFLTSLLLAGFANALSAVPMSRFSSNKLFDVEDLKANGFTFGGTGLTSMSLWIAWWFSGSYPSFLHAFDLPMYVLWTAVCVGTTANWEYMLQQNFEVQQEKMAVAAASPGNKTRNAAARTKFAKEAADEMKDKAFLYRLASWPNLTQLMFMYSIPFGGLAWVAEITERWPMQMVPMYHYGIASSMGYALSMLSETLRDRKLIDLKTDLLLLIIGFAFPMVSVFVDSIAYGDAVTINPLDYWVQFNDFGGI